MTESPVPYLSALKVLGKKGIIRTFLLNHPQPLNQPRHHLVSLFTFTQQVSPIKDVSAPAAVARFTENRLTPTPGTYRTFSKNTVEELLPTLQSSFTLPTWVALTVLSPVTRISSGS